MVLWVLLALMTGAAVLSVLLPLSRRAGGGPEPKDDVTFYRAQIAEIDRDRDRGLIREAEAEAAKAEAGRRLLRASAAPAGLADPGSEPALRRRRAASALALSVVPLVGLAVYGALGSPHLTRQAIVEAQAAAEARRTEGEARRTEFAGALEKLEAHLAASPNDFRAWDVIAPVYFRLGRFADAAKAYEKARGAGDTVERLLGQGESLVVEGKGVVPAEARAVFERGIALDPSSARARFYLALADEQAGEADKAREAYGALLAGAPANAPWVAMVRSRLERLNGGGGPTPEQVAAVPAGSVSPEMIEGMVGGLDARLKEKGGTEGEWSRLVRSYVVLGKRDEAEERLGRAREALAKEPEARARLDRLAADLGLAGGRQ